MLIIFPCTTCQSSLEIEAAACGSHVNCPKCGTALVVPKRGPGPGVTVGGFRIEKLLGRGGMGEVYLARQLSLDRQVALKILPSAMGMQKPMVERFLHEVKLLARLEHANIVTAHEAGEDSGILYLAMAYVKGESLSERLLREGKLAEKDALLIVRKLSLALNYAWSGHHILHRDIKPDNILLDVDGEPKLVDLGLSKSLDDGSALSLAGTIMGTPNYMSPEQANGNADTDFRTDMYSLGATLYHMLTGNPPFAGSTVMDTIRKQISEPLPDPRLSNPAVSEASVALLEIMLAKQPEDRYESWEGLVEDLDWVLAGNQPSRAAPAESTLLRMRPEGGPTAHKKTAAKRRSSAPLIAGIAAVMLIAAGVVISVLLLSRPKPAKLPPVIAAVPPQTALDARLAKLHQAFSNSLHYVVANPEDYAGARQRFMALQEDAAGTAVAEMAAAELDRLAKNERNAIDQALAELQIEVDRHVADGDYEAALNLLRDDTGLFADELATARMELARMVTEKATAAAEALATAPAAIDTELAITKARAEAQWAEARLAVAQEVLFQKFDSALAAIGQAATRNGLASRTADLGKLEMEVKAVSRLPEVVLAGFEADIGKRVQIALINGTITLEIRKVLPDQLEVRRSEHGASVIQALTYQHLSPPEKYRRLGQEARPDLEIMRGLLAYQGQRPDLAMLHFKQAGTELSKGIVAYLDQTTMAAQEQAARTAYGNLMAAAGFSSADTRIPEELIRTIRRSARSEHAVEHIRNAVAEFREQYGTSATAREAEPILTAMSKIGTIPREVDPKVLDQAIEALKKANPAARELNPIISITEAGIELNLSGNGELRDLRALAGLPIVELNLSGCAVENIQPLKGMPLKELNINGCNVQNLAPLSGAPLEVLEMRGNSRVATLAPLKGMPLRKLMISGGEIKDIRPLEGMPLEYLQLFGVQVRDLQPLKGAPLRTFTVHDNKVIKSLAGIEGAPLQGFSTLNCPELSDLSALKGAPVISINISGIPRLADIKFVEGMPLQRLNLADTSVKDLSPLRNSPIGVLKVQKSPIGNVSSLSACPNLSIIILPQEAQGIDALRKLPSLKSISYSVQDQTGTPAEFWKEFDAAKK